MPCRETERSRTVNCSAAPTIFEFLDMETAARRLKYEKLGRHAARIPAIDDCGRSGKANRRNRAGSGWSLTLATWVALKTCGVWSLHTLPSALPHASGLSRPTAFSVDCRLRAADQLDEIAVRLELAELLGELLHRVDRMHGRQRAAEHRHGMERVGGEQFFLATSARL